MITSLINGLMIHMTDEVKNNSKAIRGYAFYDWGKSAFETSVTAAILPAWFAYLFLEANGLTTTLAGIEMSGSAIWSYSVAIATFLVAFVSPSLGVIADRRAIKLWWLRILTVLGAGATFLLAAAPFLPISSQWAWLMLMFILANIGLNGAGVFYNALLPHLGTEEEMDAISNKAFAYGYFGGGILLVVHLGLVMGVSGDWVIPFCMATSGIWWFGFSLITFRYIPEPKIENEMEEMGFVDSSKFAIKEVMSTISERKKFKTLFLFMIAYFFYIDGINSVTALAGVFGPAVLGLTTTDLIMTIVVIQFVAAPCAIGFTHLADKWSTKKALQLSLLGATIVAVLALTFAPLQLEEHTDYDLQYTWDNENSTYSVTYLSNLGELAQDPENEEQIWAIKHRNVLPVQENEQIKDDLVLEWATDENGDVATILLSDISMLESLKSQIENSRYSISIQGENNDTALAGIDHPTNLGDGPLDFIAKGMRDLVWQPLGISVTIQFLILGVLFGSIMGGCQGLSRSLFGKMVPETRSAEFFGFFGFFGKVAAFIGPLLYGTMVILFDDRVGILSIGLLIIIGTLMMRLVNVEEGIEDARLEDERNRSKSSN
tara:strand:- start:239 stop:2047 length:1809 start_codon:yes stop_codon:yes gene_type:complete